MSKSKLLLIIIGIGLLIIISLKIAFAPKAPSPTANIQQSAKPTNSSNEAPKIVSTKPDPLENNFINATDIVEITFNRSLENVGEFKSRMEPEIEYKVELSGDRKTARIIPTKPYRLGTTYTLFIGPDTKFDGAGNWGEDKIFHFRTIKYTGV